MPIETVSISDRERQVIEEVAAIWGVSLEEAADRLRREGLANRVRAKTGRSPAKVYDLHAPKRLH